MKEPEKRSEVVKELLKGMPMIGTDKVLSVDKAAKIATTPRINIPKAINPKASQVYVWALAQVVLASALQVASGVAWLRKLTTTNRPTYKMIMVVRTATTAPLI